MRRHALFVREAPRGAPANPGRRRRHSSRRQGGAPDLGYSERRHSGGRRTRPSATSLTDPPRRVRPPLPPPTARGPAVTCVFLRPAAGACVILHPLARIVLLRPAVGARVALADKGRPRGDGAGDGGRSCTSPPPPWHPALRRTHACRRTAAHPRRPPLPRARAVAACAGRCVPTPTAVSPRHSPRRPWLKTEILRPHRAMLVPFLLLTPHRHGRCAGTSASTNRSQTLTVGRRRFFTNPYLPFFN